MRFIVQSLSEPTPSSLNARRLLRAMRTGAARRIGANALFVIDKGVYTMRRVMFACLLYAGAAEMSQPAAAYWPDIPGVNIQTTISNNKIDTGTQP